MYDFISDYRMQTIFKKYIKTLPPYTQHILRGFRECGEHALPSNDKTDILVVRATRDNGESSAHFINLVRCHSAWACPYCTARVMSQKKDDIAAAIDVLDATQKLDAAMLTFTIPHRAFQSIDDVWIILQNTWREFSKTGSAAIFKNKHQRKDGSVAIYKTFHSKFARFRYECENKYNVRVYEFTYGKKNGWHPHIHALYWFPHEKFNSITDYEKTLHDLWFKCARKMTKKFYCEYHSYSDADADAITAKIFSRCDWSEQHYCFFISKNLDGTPRKITSSEYLSEWSGEQELTSQYKQAADGHYSIPQITEKITSAKTFDEQKPWLELFTEYAIATRGCRRVQWAARTDIKKIIADWKLHRETDKSILKKKVTFTVTPKVVYWFDEEEWYVLRHQPKDEADGSDNIIVQIIQRARLPDAQEQISQLLIARGLKSMVKVGTHYKSAEYEKPKTFVA